jgi:hypothetical protein
MPMINGYCWHIFGAPAVTNLLLRTQNVVRQQWIHLLLAHTFPGATAVAFFGLKKSFYNTSCFI